VVQKSFDMGTHDLERVYESSYICYTVEHDGVPVGFFSVNDEPH